MLIDTHAHLNFAELISDIDGVLARAKEAGVEKIIVVGTNLEDSKIAVELAQKYQNLYATIGIHPDSPSPSASDWSKFEKLALSPKVVAIGECGLDHKTGLPGQKEIFEKQIGIARKFYLPLVIHVRDAQEDLMEILNSGQNDGLRGVFHCFSGNEKYLEFVLGLGFYVSFAGNVTFKNAQNLRELAKSVSLDRLLVETDCPFLAPEPLRGSTNEPANVKITSSKLAEIKNVTFEELSKITTANADRLFNF